MNGRGFQHGTLARCRTPSLFLASLLMKQMCYSYRNDQGIVVKDKVTYVRRLAIDPIGTKFALKF